jgi:hypothetical protein
MTERPIPFSAPDVRAILDGTKTQTRRVVTLPRKHQHRGEPTVLFYNTGSGQYPGGHPTYTGDQPPGLLVRYSEGTVQKIASPYGIPGGRLWVREAWRICAWPPNDPMMIEYRDGSTHETADTDALGYEEWYERMWIQCGEDCERAGMTLGEDVYEWPEEGRDDVPTRWRPSIFMPRWASRLTLEVGVVRVERVQDISEADARAEGVASRDEFRALWDSINGKRPGCDWASNPWTWCVSFRRIEQ